MEKENVVLKVVGIDVGGPRKGYHVVGVSGRTPVLFKSSDPAEIAHWCEDFGALAIAVDAPCRWSLSGRSRACELKLKALRAKASRELGERFDLRRFHNVVLDDGALPLAVLEARVDEWIRNQKGKRT